jgi:hypothetical protein
MRGSLKLFAEIQEAPTLILSAPRQGRSADLHTRRNACLVDRYHYYLHFTDKRYTRILSILSHEFFLAPFTIQERLNENYDSLLKLKAEKPPKTHFAKKWPHLIW